MMRVIPLVVLLASLGCQMSFGKATPEEFTGLSFQLGQVTGGGGLKGAAISVPGATAAGEIVKAAASAAMSVVGRAPVVVLHEEE